MIGRIAPAILQAGRQPLIFGLLIAGLALYFAYHLTRFRLTHFWPSFAAFGDAAILFEMPRKIFAIGDYPARLAFAMNEVFPYPPPGVLVFKLLGAAGSAPFMAVWIVLMAAALVVSLRAPLAGESQPTRAAWPAVAAAVLLFADSPVSWDLRNANSNLVCLGLVLGAYALIDRRPGLAGALIGLAISLKLQGILLLPWLLWRGSRAALLGALVTLLLLWVIAPVAIFGLDGAIRMLAGWREQLRIISDPWIYTFIQAGVGPPLVSVRRAAMTLTGQGPETSATLALVATMWAAWVAVLGWYGWRALRSVAPVAPSRAALADWSVLLLAPLPFSPWLEPYHAMPMLPGIAVCVLVALDARAEMRDRSAALIALAMLAAIRLAGVPFEMRAIGILGSFVVLVVALGYLRPRLAAAREVDAPISRPARSPAR